MWFDIAVSSPFLSFQEGFLRTFYPFYADWCSCSLASVDWILDYQVIIGKRAGFAFSVKVSENSSFIWLISVAIVHLEVFKKKKRKEKKITVFHFPCSTACLVGITGVLAPVLEETVFRGFLMVSLTQWYDSSRKLSSNLKHSLV